LSAVAAARAAFDELTRQLVLERRYAVLTPRRGERPPEFSADLREVFDGFEARGCTFPELEPLLAHADRVLVLSDGLVFNVALLRLCLDGAPLAARLSLEKLVEMGGFYSHLTGTVGQTRMALTFQIYEIHPGPLSLEWRAASRRYRRRGLARPLVGVGVTALDASAGKLWSNFPGLVRLSHRLLVKRAFSERASTLAQRKKRVARRGFLLEWALVGVAVGAALGVGALKLLLELHATTGDLYAGAALLASAVGAVVSLKSCRICERTVAQSLAGGLGACGAIVLGWWRMHLPMVWSLAGLATIVALVSLTVGFVADPRRLKR